ncbi:hypothetical protein SAMN06269185_3297 [Natronoarchaeum philippinense]|uniref:Uncharacterized protein n=1 Tax=Natronoarchaeum philippinense TaxID=558529 RepID=A0A285PDJ2_NATPI|nr:hypothetical protein [Natronoarchaeum philippinense]SNZ18216.1 hypothetical protein SAMN06269185_3297 [Natronoarchaeum philippinense]
MTETGLSIDRDSKALQYRILDAGDHWVLERAAPEFSLTPDEFRATELARSMLPTDRRDRIVVPPIVQQEIDAGAGDAISLVVVVNAHVRVFTDAMQTAIDPLIDAMANAAEAFSDAFASAVSSALSSIEPDAGGQDRDAQLPEPIRAARRRREQQRETARRTTGAHYPGDDPHV